MNFLLLCCALFGVAIAVRYPGHHGQHGHHGQYGHHGHHGHSRHLRLPVLPPADNVKFIFVGFRHSNRNPAQPLKDDTSYATWAWEGPEQQTNIGKRQGYALGQFLRQRYGNLIPDEFTVPVMKAYSPSEGSKTMQAMLAGLFPPKGRAVWNPALLWTPISVAESDPLLRMSVVPNCPRYAEVNKPIADDSDSNAQRWLNKDPDLVQYIAKNSGLNPNLNDLGDVADNILAMKLQNVPLPDWVTNPTLPGYTSKEMFAAVTSFSDARSVVCANNHKCARLSAGYWLDDIIQTLLQVNNGTLQSRVGNFYATYTETVLSLIRLIHAEHIAFTPPAAGLILEYTDTPVPAVRALFHEPDHHNSETVHKASFKSLPYCHGQEWCPLDTFIQHVKKHSFGDWQAACGVAKCP